jgi:hypothetical protein
MDNVVVFTSAFSAVIGALVICTDVYLDRINRKRTHNKTIGTQNKNAGIFTSQYLGYIAIITFIIMYAIFSFRSERRQYFFKLILIDLTMFVIVVVLTSIPIVFLVNKLLVSRIQSRALKGIISLLGGIGRQFSRLS